MRTKAFIDAEEDRVAANQKAMEAAKLKAAMERNSGDISEEEILEEEETHEHQAESSEVVVMEEPEDEELIEKEMSTEEESVEKLKELIAD